MAAEVRKVLFPAAPTVGDSLLGLVFQTASENHLGSTSMLLTEAGLPTGREFNLALDHEQVRPRLAEVLRIHPAAVEERCYAACVDPAPLPMVDFHGAPVFRDDLRFRPRRVAGASLAKSEHHRALWHHALVPYCPETGALLSNACFRCRGAMGFYHAVGMSTCERCDADQREAPDTSIASEVRAVVDPILNLLHPDRSRHGPALAALPVEVRTLGRGLAFEFGWRLGWALDAACDDRPRNRHGSFAPEERVRILASGAAVLAGWPEALLCRLRDVEAEGGERLTACIDRLRWARRAKTGFAGHAKLLLEGQPQLLAETSTRAVHRLLRPGLVDGGDACRLLGTGSHRFAKLHRSGLIGPVFAGGEINLHASFEASALERSGQAFRDRVSIASCSDRLGVTHHGVEQLVCVGLLAAIGDPLVRHVFPELQIGRSSLESLKSLIVEGGSEESDLDVPLAQALKLIGGREKPIGPIAQAMLAGTIRFRVAPTGSRLLGRVLIGIEDACRLASFRFDAAQHPDFAFSDTMPRRDAQEVLNLTPCLLMAALGGELGRAEVDRKRLDRNAVLDIARRHMSGAELRRRFLGGSGKYPSDLREGGRVARNGAVGWPRDEVELLFAAMPHA